MKEKILKQVRLQLLSKLDKYRKADGISYDGGVTHHCHSDDYLEEDVYYSIKNTIPLSPKIDIYLEQENLYRVEVNIEDAIDDYFYFSIFNEELIFDHEREMPFEIRCPDINEEEFFGTGDKEPDPKQSLIPPTPEYPLPSFIPYIQFTIDESEYRIFERNRNRKRKLQQLNQRL